MLLSVNLIPAGTGMQRYRRAEPVIVEDEEADTVD